MTTLHFVFKLDLEFFDPATRRSVGRVPLFNTLGDNRVVVGSNRLPQIREIMRRKFNVNDWNGDDMFGWVNQILLFHFDGSVHDYYYDEPYFHMWVVRNAGVDSPYLAQVLREISPDGGGVDGWMGGDISAISEEEAFALGLGGVDLIPIVHKIYIVQEKEVDINRL